jgi:hypothetical protein
MYKDLFGRMLGYDLTFISQRYFFLLMICYMLWLCNVAQITICSIKVLHLLYSLFV